MEGRSAYEFEEGPDGEQARLAAVEGAFDSVTRCLLLKAGARAGWRCWEVGAGNGSVARWLAGVVGADGAVLATDLDDRGFDAGGTDVVFARHDVVTDPPPGGRFDLVHARFLLEHLRDPRLTIERLRGSLVAGGVLVLEDSSGLRLGVTPPAPVFDRLPAAWEIAGRTVGWDPSYGQRLVPDLRAAGLSAVRGREHRRVAPGGPAWAHLRYGLERLRDPLLEQGITEAELQHVLCCLADASSVVIGPPVLGVYGWR